MARLALFLAGLLALGCFGGGAPARPQELPPRIRPPRAIAPRVATYETPRVSSTSDGLAFDPYELSNERYGRFLAAVAQDGHRFCHADEPRGKDHSPVHWKDPRFDHPDQPVVGVDWFDAWACARFEGKRLPTSVEWDLAARGPEGRLYPWGKEHDPARYNHGSPRPPWYDDSDGALYPAPGGQFAGDQNGGGIYDLMGNVREWCADGPEGRRYVRGQAWYQTYGQEIGDLGQFLEFDPLERSFTLGFRCVADGPR